MMHDESAPGRAAMIDSVFSARRFALLLGVLVGACFAPVVLGFQSFVYRDFSLFGHPLAYYYHESFWRGEIPLWNPLNNCGLPFMAQWNTMVFYPPSLIYLLLPLPWSLNVFCLLHLWFGGLGMYFLARRWTGSNFAAAFAGLVFSFNGLALHCLMWPNNIAALGWMPWVWLLIERASARGGRSLVPAILAGACQFMAGAPEVFLLTWVGAAVVWFGQAISDRSEFWKSFVRFGAVVVGIVALSAVQLLPLLDLVRHSQRTASFDTGSWAMPPWGWANFLVPLFRTMPTSSGPAFQLGQMWTSSYYFGIATVWLALIALLRIRSARIWSLAALVAVGLVMALGDAGHLWPWIKNHVGALGFMRYPVKWVFLLACPLTLLAAFGLRELVTAARREPSENSVEHDSRPIPAVVYWGLLALVLAATGIVSWVGWRHPLPDESASISLASGLTRACFLIGLAALLWFWRRAPGQRARAVSIGCLIVIAADLLTHVPWQNPTVAPSLLAPGLETHQELRSRVSMGQARLMQNLAALNWFHHLTKTNAENSYLARRLGLSHNLNLLEGIAKPDGFFSLYLSEEQDVENRLFYVNDNMHRPIADVMAISYATAPEKLFDWSARPDPLPVISAGQQPVFLPETNILGALTQTNFDPRVTVILPSNLQPEVSATRQREARIIAEKFRPQLIDFRVTTPGTAMVFISQAYYHPWKVYVDDQAVPLFRANHAFQAVQVPAGEHRVRLRYEDKMFHAGAIISAATLAILVLGSRRWRQR